MEDRREKRVGGEITGDGMKNANDHTGDDGEFG